MFNQAKSDQIIYITGLSIEIVQTLTVSDMSKHVLTFRLNLDFVPTTNTNVLCFIVYIV